MNLTRGINLRKIAEMMPGASGAEVKGVCTEAGMYALRERRVHVTQEDFEMAVAKVMQKDSEKNMSIKKLWKQKGLGGKERGTAEKNDETADIIKSCLVSQCTDSHQILLAQCLKLSRCQLFIDVIIPCTLVIFQKT